MQEPTPPRIRRDLLAALAIFAVASAVYAVTAYDRVTRISPHFHFVDLAQSFLDGRLDTDTPRRTRGGAPRADDAPGLQDAVNRALTDGKGESVGWNDWANYRVITLRGGEQLSGVWPWKDQKDERKHEFHTLDGNIAIVDSSRDVARTCGPEGRSRCDEKKFFISFPPFPAVVMLPFVALWGYYTNDVLITVLFAGANVALLFLLLTSLQRQGYSQRSMEERLWLTALFGFGTVAYFSSVRGEVWFTALVMGLAFHIGYVMCAVDARRPFWAGTFLAAAFATRTPLLFAVAFFAVQLFWPASGERRRWPDIFKRGALFAVPTVVGGIALMVYNAARFDNPLEFGHMYLVEGTRDSIRQHGLFSMWFLNRNLQAAFLNFPVLTSSAPFVHVTRHGLGLFVTTAPFVYLLWPQGEGSRLRTALWIATASIVIPALLYQNTGWAQFGYRFSLDFTPYLMALLAVDTRPLDKKYKALILLAIIVNLFGAITFGRAAMFYYD